MISGTTMFQIQMAIYRRLDGMFGLSSQKKLDVGVALDAAAIAGALMERKGIGGFSLLSNEELENLLAEKFIKLGAKS